MAHAHTATRAASHDAPRRHSGRGRGWWALVVALKERIAEDRLSVIAAGVAFYAMLAVFPALAALVALYGLALDPQQVTEQLSQVALMLPPQALQLLDARLQALLSDRTALSFGAIAGLLLALWSTSAGVRALMKALNVAYDEEERRGFFKQIAVSLLLTLGAIAGGIVAIVSVVVLPAVLDFLGLGPLLSEFVSLARWPLVMVLFWFGLLVVYRYGPSHQRVHWSWVNPGAAVATVLWIAGSGAFSLYVSTFANYNKTYGSVAGVVVLLMWFLLSAWAVLIGAEINAEMEQRARRQGATVDEAHRRPHIE